MQFAVISDSHGFTDNVENLGRRLIASGMKLAVHLGDNWEDAQALEALGLEIIRVPGVFHEVYQDESVPNRLLTELGGLKILLTHSRRPHEKDLPGDGDPAEIARREKPDLVLFGHSHLPEISDEDGVLWVNPGHLKPEDKKGSPPSYALIDTGTGPAKVRILAFDDDRVLMAT